MKIKAWLKYLVLIALILSVQFLSLAYFRNLIDLIHSYWLVNIIYIILGMLLGVECFISVLRKKGSLKINLPKLVFIGLPSLYYCAVYAHNFIITYEDSKNIFLFPAYVIFRYVSYNGEYILPVFPLILGYSIITCIYRQDGGARRKQIKIWLKYLIYGVSILLIQLCASRALVNGYDVPKEVHLTNILLIFFYGGAGILLGVENLTSDIKKEGVWKIHIPKIVLMGIPSLYISLYSFSGMIASKLIQDLLPKSQADFRVNFGFLRNSFSVFPIILGYSIITALYKSRAERSKGYRINAVITYIESIMERFGGFLKRNCRRTIALIICIVTFSVILINVVFDKRMKDIPGISFNNVTSITFRYQSKDYQKITVSDSERIKEFIDLLDKCVVRKRILELPRNESYVSAEIKSGNSGRVIIDFIGNCMTIYPYQGTITEIIDYKIIWNRISDKRLEEFSQYGVKED